MMVELIVYLEPNLEFKTSVENFLKSVKETNTAVKYGCHISMTGFFHVNEEETITVKELLDVVLDQFNNTVDQIPIVNLNALVIKKENIPVHLLLPVTGTDDYKRFMSVFAEKSKETVTLRLKRIDHISLAYWDEPNATPTEQSQWKEYVEQGLFDKLKEQADIYFQKVKPPTHWDIALYKRVVKGELVGQEHIFQELGRWSTTTTTT